MKEKYLFKTSIGRTSIFFWLILFTPIVLCIKYNTINPQGFNIIIIICLLISFLIPTQEIIVNESELEINYNRFFNLIKSKNKICYNLIRNIEIQDSKWKFGIVAPIFPLKYGKTIIINFQDNSNRIFSGLYFSLSDMKNATDFINEQIKNSK